LKREHEEASGAKATPAYSSTASGSGNQTVNR